MTNQIRTRHIQTPAESLETARRKQEYAAWRKAYLEASDAAWREAQAQEDARAAGMRPPGMRPPAAPRIVSVLEALRGYVYVHDIPYKRMPMPDGTPGPILLPNDVAELEEVLPALVAKLSRKSVTEKPDGVTETTIKRDASRNSVTEITPIVTESPTVTESPAIKRDARGRPPKANSLTPAQRAAAYRARRKA